LAQDADLTLVGIGQMGQGAPLVVDGFVPPSEMDALVAAGAAGEITSWIYDREGHLLDCEFNARVASVPLPKAAQRRGTAVRRGRGETSRAFGGAAGTARQRARHQRGDGRTSARRALIRLADRSPKPAVDSTRPMSEYLPTA